MRTALVASFITLIIAPLTILLGIATLAVPDPRTACPDAGSPAAHRESRSVGETARVLFPLPSGTWIATSGFGTRVHPITGERKLHTGADYAAPDGTPILAVADGRVAFAGPAPGYGNLVLLQHRVNGRTVVTGYGHMEAATMTVQGGDLVEAGQPIAAVGSAGYSTGPHLHFELRPGASDGPPVDPAPWLEAPSVGAIAVSETAASTCSDSEPAGAYVGATPDVLVPDPTTTGRLTSRTAHVLAQIRNRFPETAWSCWSPRPGTNSEHPLGRACDGTFGNTIGHAATGDALALGWRVTRWLQDNAVALAVDYLIWQGRIWSVARASEGWRPYGGGGMHDPANVTGGHYDHLHWTARTEN